LWEQQFGWNVLITCNGMTWKVHRHILTRGSDWFAGKLPPVDPVRSSSACGR
jgi:hypothetical protein